MRTERSHFRNSRAAIESVIDRTRPRRVLVLGCGDGEATPLERLSRGPALVDFVDVNEAAIGQLRERLRDEATGEAVFRFHVADLTGRVHELRGWANEVAFGAETAEAFVNEASRKLLDLVPDFWRAPEIGRYDLVICANVITQLPLSILSVIDQAFRDRFGARAADVEVRDALDRASWTFARSLEERLMAYLDALATRGGVVYLSGSVHVHAITSPDLTPDSVGGAWRMTATPFIRDYLRPWHTVIEESAWDWVWEDPAPGRWGRLYKIQAVSYRTPRASEPAAAPRTPAALPGVRIPKQPREVPAAARESETVPTTPWLRRRVRAFGREIGSYTLFALIGFAAASGLTVLLAWLSGRSPWTLAAALGLVFPTILVTAWIGKVRTGRERLTFYRYAAVYLLVAAVSLRVIGQPVLGNLELIVLGTMVFQAFGRLGCMMAGCCYGRPSAFGVRYGTSHARNGFPSHLAGVRVLPVQALETIVCAVAFVLGATTLLSGAPVGATAAACVTVYAAGRFVLEELRGDLGRPHWLGLSEAQWTSLVLLGGVAGLGLFRWTPLAASQSVAAGLAWAAGLILVSIRRRVPRIDAPAPVRDLARALHSLRTAGRGGEGAPPRVVGAGTMDVSLEPVTSDSGGRWLVTLSRTRAWGRMAARRVSATVRELTHSSRAERLPGRPELLHLLLTPSTRLDGTTSGGSHGV